MKYRKKVLIVDAERWDPSNPEPVLDWLGAHGCHYAVLPDGRLGIGTLESGKGLDRHAGKPGDYVIRGIKGEFYVCDAEIFQDSYDPEEEAAA